MNYFGPLSRPSLLAQKAHNKMILAAGIITENVALTQTECQYFRLRIVPQDHQSGEKRVKLTSGESGDPAGTLRATFWACPFDNRTEKRSGDLSLQFSEWLQLTGAAG